MNMNNTNKSGTIKFKSVQKIRGYQQLEEEDHQKHQQQQQNKVQRHMNGYDNGNLSENRSKMNESMYSKRQSEYSQIRKIKAELDEIQKQHKSSFINPNQSIIEITNENQKTDHSQPVNNRREVELEEYKTNNSYK